MSATTKNEATTSKTPSHLVYHVRDNNNGGKGFWTRIGAAWAHQDGNGFNVQLEGLMPLDGRLVLRIPSDKKE